MQHLLAAVLIFFGNPADLPNWEIALFSSLATLVTTALLEPFKVRVSARFKRKSLQRALYLEITNLWFHIIFLEAAAENEKTSPSLTGKIMQFIPSVYNNARSQPDIFYQLTEASHIDAAYSDVKWMFQPVDVTEVSSIKLEAARSVLSSVVLFADKKLFRKINVGMVNEIEARRSRK